MTTETKKPLKLFYCYARKDKDLRDELDIHLSSLKRQNLITSWYDGEISPGEAWEKKIDDQLQSAHIILLLVTPHFIASDYCYGVEMQRALKRHQNGTTRVIPIILRRTFWEGTPFSSLQVLPDDAKPVTQWTDQDEAFWNITVGIHKTIIELQIFLKTKQRELLDEGGVLNELKRYEEALTIFEQAIKLDPTNAWAYGQKGDVLVKLKRYEEALIVCEQAINLDPTNVWVYGQKGYALNRLKRYEEAIAAYDQAIGLDPTYMLSYFNKGYALLNLRRYEEAVVAYDQVIHLDPNCAPAAYSNKGDALRNLKRYEEAIAAYGQAISLNPNDAKTYTNKGIALDSLKRHKDAVVAYDQAISLNPNDAEAYTNKGIALLNLKHPEEAQRCYQMVRQLRDTTDKT